MKKRIFGLLTALVFLVSSAQCIHAASIVDSGEYHDEYGNDYTWTLDSEGTFKINGTGNIKWFDISNYSIKKAIIGEGITFFGQLFCRCKSLASISLPEGIGDIANGAFEDCTNLVDIILPNSCTGITLDSFMNCSSLKTINIPSKVNLIYCGDEGTPFRGCTSLESINVDKNNTYYYSIDGNLFRYPTNYDQNPCLLKYASGKNDKSYTIPYNCTVYYRAFEDCDGTTLTDVYTYLDEESVSTLREYSPNLNFHIIKPCSIDTLSVNNNRITVNLSNVSRDCELVTAFYSGKKIVDIKTAPLKSGDTQKTVAITSNRSDSAKVYIWSSLSGMDPQCEAKSITIK